MTWVQASGARLRVGKVVCLVRNYRAHAEEFGQEVPPDPVYFLKPATALIHDGEEVLVPAGVTDLQAEAELAVVMGSDASQLREQDAYKHILGYAVFLDMTARDLQRRASRKGMPWSLAKGMDTFGPVSTVRPIDEVPDPHGLEIVLRVNGRITQQSTTAMMVHRIPRILATITEYMTLERGDMVATGTPEGVPKVVPGDLLEAEISGVGQVRVAVRAAD